MGEGLPWEAIDVARARQRIASDVIHTPLVPAPEIPGLEAAGPVYLKLENLQRTGAFKIRGALNKIAALPDEVRRRGVVAASAGNHAQGVAWAARRFGIPATIVMPSLASPLKVRRTRALGAEVVLEGADYEEAYGRAIARAEQEGRTFVHPYDDADVIAGQGTVGREILEDLPSVGRVVAGVGGGGLLAGIACALRQAGSAAEVVGVQPLGASTLAPSLARGTVVTGGRPATFADGLATRHVGTLPLAILREAKATAITVDDRSIARAAFLLLEGAKVLAEGAAAAALAGLLSSPASGRTGPTVVVVSGGNLDPFLLDRILFIGLADQGRLLRLSGTLRDVPGQLAEFLGIASSARANVREIRHARESADSVPGEVVVEVDLDVRDRAHAEEVLARYRAAGWTVRALPLGPD
ncbi:MAG: threonine ammonia-lyase [Thermoplasmata archaeon]